MQEKTHRNTLRCSPDSFDSLQSFVEPSYYKKYVFHTYYGNGCCQDGDGIGGAAAQLGRSRPAACRYIKNLEILLYEMMDDVIYFPSPYSSDD
ncbi:hypothetical protein PHMEG_00027579 [Phytophthora megakarya]|uniref:Uncharacterized protein n=1 Tax=Phytophthora megakarya TaxID=4795 RepID=A0A225V7L7_9STRA|nr:hypothetical protein PHMEG_00027579 [Phytophthora megakarya]